MRKKGRNPAFKNEQKGSLEDLSRHDPVLRAKIAQGRKQQAADQRHMEEWAANDFESGPLTDEGSLGYGGTEDDYDLGGEG